MPREATFISKALKLVSLALIVATVAIAATAAYSGYEEYGALTASVGSNGTGELSVALNGSTLVISGLTVPNKMTFPLTLELLGNVTLDNATIGIFDSGAYLIPPNESKSVNVSIPLSFKGLLGDASALREAMVNSTELSITTTVSAHMVPLLGINITKSANTTAGPILGDLTANLNESAEQLSPNGQAIDVPLVLTWQNTSPLSAGTLWLNASLTEIPGSPMGNYASVSAPLNFVQGQNQQSFELTIPISYLHGRGLSSGTYSINLDFSQSESSPPLIQIPESASV